MPSAVYHMSHTLRRHVRDLGHLLSVRRNTKLAAPANSILPIQLLGCHIEINACLVSGLCGIRGIGAIIKLEAVFG